MRQPRLDRGAEVPVACPSLSVTPTGDQQLKATMVIPAGVTEVVLDLTRPRLISVTGIGRGGKRHEYHLKVTPKGKLLLI